MSASGSAFPASGCVERSRCLGNRCRIDGHEHGLGGVGVGLARGRAGVGLARRAGVGEFGGVGLGEVPSCVGRLRHVSHLGNRERRAGAGGRERREDDEERCFHGG